LDAAALDDVDATSWSFAVAPQLEAVIGKMSVQDPYKPLRLGELLAALAIFVVPASVALLAILVGPSNMSSIPEWLSSLVRALSP
jgi:hypothetical protein